MPKLLDKDIKVIDRPDPKDPQSRLITIEMPQWAMDQIDGKLSKVGLDLQHWFVALLTELAEDGPNSVAGQWLKGNHTKSYSD